MGDLKFMDLMTVRDTEVHPSLVKDQIIKDLGLSSSQAKEEVSWNVLKMGKSFRFTRWAY